MPSKIKQFLNKLKPKKERKPDFYEQMGRLNAKRFEEHLEMVRKFKPKQPSNRF